MQFIEAFSIRIPVPIEALYFKGIESIRKMLATKKDLWCLIQPIRISYRTPSINNWLNSVRANINLPIVNRCPIDNSNPPKPSSRRRHRSIRDQINQAVETAVNYCFVHQINTIMFGCYLGKTQFVPEGKAHNQKFVQILQTAKISTLLAAKPGSCSALTTPLSIKILAILSQKIELEASPFLSCGGVSKHQ